MDNRTFLLQLIKLINVIKELRKVPCALAIVVGASSPNPRVVGSIPGQGIYLGCGFIPGVGTGACNPIYPQSQRGSLVWMCAKATKKATNGCFFHIDILSLFLSLSQKANENVLR